MEVRENDRNDNTFDMHLEPDEALLVYQLGFIPGLEGVPLTPAPVAKEA